MRWVKAAPALRHLPLAAAARDIERHTRPIYAVWETTLRCDLACHHCGSRAGRERPDELSTAECLDLVKQMADLHATALRARVAEQLTLRRLLTPEQREKLSDLPPSRRPRPRRPSLGASESDKEATDEAPASAEADDALELLSLTAS